jgi:hypothetical protein
MYAELYEETLRFEEDALNATIEEYQDQYEAMSMRVDEEGEDDCACPVCKLGVLNNFDTVSGRRGCHCTNCAARLIGANVDEVSKALVEAASMHGAICVNMELQWAMGQSSLHCRCTACGAVASKEFRL